jgi:phage I-like protein
LFFGFNNLTGEIMNLILNRNFELPEDGWYQLAPIGEFPHAAAGINQVIDETACARMVTAFENARAAADNFPGLLIDFDHFSLDASRHSEAAGWITDLKLMPNGGGLFARIRWSDTGEAAVKGGRYRFLSPVWAKSDCEDLGSHRLRPVRLLNAAVTNDPNLKGILPISNRSSAEPVDSASLDKSTGAPVGRPNQKEKLMQPVIDALLNKLNLPADTAQDAVLAAIENMSAPEEFTALLNRAETAETRLAGFQAAQLEADADAFLEANAALIENRDDVRAQFIENRTLTEAVFKNLKVPKPVTPPLAPDTRRPLHNRDSKVAATQNRDASTSESKAVKIRNRAAEIMKTERVAYTEAFRRAEQELSA